MADAMAQALAVGKARPVTEGIFEISPSGRVQVIGGRCVYCGAITFPRTPRCPQCFQSGMQHYPLAETGVIDSFTIVRQGPKEWKGTVPYALARVKLDDGAVVTSHLQKCPFEQVKIGMRVRLQPSVLYREEDADVLGPVFVPEIQREGDF